MFASLAFPWYSFTISGDTLIFELSIYSWTVRGLDALGGYGTIPTGLQIMFIALTVPVVTSGILDIIGSFRKGRKWLISGGITGIVVAIFFVSVMMMLIQQYMIPLTSLMGKMTVPANGGTATIEWGFGLGFYLNIIGAFLVFIGAVLHRKFVPTMKPPEASKALSPQSQKGS